MKIEKPIHFKRESLYYINDRDTIRIRTAMINDKVAMRYRGKNPWRLFTLEEYEDILVLLNFL